MHIGLYFGSFNPIHNGHLAIAQYMYTNYNFDEIWFVISPNSPFKQEKDMLNANIRLQLVQIAIENIPFFKASDIEFDMPTPSYTYRTLRKIRKLYPNNQYSIIMGGDNIDNIHLWKNYTEIIQNHTIYIYPRIESKNITYSHHCIIAPNVPILNISASEIRTLIRQTNWEKVAKLVPEKVFLTLKNKKYYQ